ncbi:MULTISPECIES: sulfonate ABC transporter substrate-binding protein [unclassified Sporolactobacillus]|uniref:sulfonate ABC transporter substrate-binding protein n=1 Tax=unclassified Sporolactobacillus TaxID=2628533 RepID=UPI0023686300|nr:sulfonate ABC transporter substrate-binding protein [Sporolactobacillus sp. CQH2019]MDD9150350.1 sulfonate ABC transporter substrate-binding protein [Sporolactobacillus sp. CQH2019]
MIKHAKFKRMFVLLLSVALLLAGCSSAQQKTNQGVIRIGYQKGDEFNIAKINGSLAKALKQKGYTVQWTEFQDGTSLLEALNAGSIDYGRTGNTPPVVEQASGANIVYVGAGASKYEGSGILVKKNSSIKSLSDLKGKKIAFSKGSSSQYLLVKGLEKVGLSMKDVTPVYMQPADASVAFGKGNVDAWVVWDPFTASAQTNENAKLLVDGQGLTTDRDFFIAKRSFAKSHQAVTALILNEVEQSMVWANKHHDALISKLASTLKMDRASITLAVNRRVYGVGKITNQILDEQQSIADQFYQLKLIPKKIDVHQAILK